MRIENQRMEEKEEEELQEITVEEVRETIKRLKRKKATEHFRDIWTGGADGGPEGSIKRYLERRRSADVMEDRHNKTDHQERGHKGR